MSFGKKKPNKKMVIFFKKSKTYIRPLTYNVRRTTNTFTKKNFIILFFIEAYFVPKNDDFMTSILMNDEFQWQFFYKFYNIKWDRHQETGHSKYVQGGPRSLEMDVARRMTRMALPIPHNGLGREEV